MPTKRELLEDKTVKELKEMAKDKDLSGYSTRRKSGLIDMIMGDYTKSEIESWPEVEEEVLPKEIELGKMEEEEELEELPAPEVKEETEEKIEPETGEEVEGFKDILIATIIGLVILIIAVIVIFQFIL